MTTREIKIAKRVLNYLHELEGGQAHPLTILGEIGGLNVCTMNEFNETLHSLENGGYIHRVRTQFKGDMISISSAGEAARLEM